jgi:hypothetical protein
MFLSDRLSRRHVGPLAVVQGDTVDALLTQLRTPRFPKITVVGDRALAERLAAADTEPGTIRPAVVVGRGLARDLDGIVAAARTSPTLLAAPVMNGYIRTETDRLTTRATVLAGYPPPPAIVQRIVIDRAVRLLTQAARRLTGYVVVHDADHALRPDAETSLTVFRRGPPPPPSAALEPAGPPSLLAIARHAEFLAVTDTATLCEMHAPFAGPEGKVLFDMWHGHLALLAAAKQADRLVGAARNTLAEQQRRLPPLPTRTPSDERV